LFERLALHMCLGNWSADESLALSGDYAPLVDILGQMNVGTLFLELATPRAGEMEILERLPKHLRIGIGSCNQKHAHVESVESIVAHVEKAIQLFGAERLLLTPDCGFATFADNPLNSDRVAEAKLAALAQAAAILRARHGVA
jgi:5-methyltetrahydropteroyltriglutamate--homocysteine methyltransferase